MTTLETLFTAAFGFDAETIGNATENAGFNIEVRFEQYEFAIYCKDDSTIIAEFALSNADEVDNPTIIHRESFNIMHSEKFAPMLAYIFYNRMPKGEHTEAFEIHLLNCDEDDFKIGAYDLACKIFKSSSYYDEDEGIYTFDTKYSFLYLNKEQLEVFKDELEVHFVEAYNDIFEDGNGIDLEYLSKVNNYYDKTMVYADIYKKQSKLLKLLTNTADIKLSKAARNLAISAEEAIANCNKEYTLGDTQAVKDCESYLLSKFSKDDLENYGLVSLSELLFNWQFEKGIKFNLMTLAVIINDILTEYKYDGAVEFADELLRDDTTSSIIVAASVL